MKYIYKTPEIHVEELTKRDVLCASNEIPNEIDNYSLSNLDLGHLEDIM